MIINKFIPHPLMLTHDYVREPQKRKTVKTGTFLRSVGVLALASVASRPILRKLRRTSSKSRRAKLGERELELLS